MEDLECVRCKKLKNTNDFSKKKNGEIYKICTSCRDKLQNYKKSKELQDTEPHETQTIPSESKEIKKLECELPPQNSPTKAFASLPPHPSLIKSQQKTTVQIGGDSDGILIYGFIFASGLFIGLTFKK
jgi:hypothetical protein